MNVNKPQCVLIMGGPASGKGTCCKQLVEEFGFVHLSIGDILREERKKDTEEAKFLEYHMKQFETTGKLMPTEIVAQFLFKAMEENGWNKKTFLVDGFIKAKGGYDCWKKMFSKVVDTMFVLYFECLEETMLKRMKIRSQTSGRSDDHDSLFQIRIKTFYGRTYPCIELFAQEGIVKVVKAEKNVEEVYADVRKYFT